jgi:hypothetical protein
VESYLLGLGLVRKAILAAGPGPEMRLRDFLERVESGEVSYIWNVPERVQEDCLPRLRNWCERTFDLEQSIEIPRMLEWTAYQKAGAASC